MVKPRCVMLFVISTLFFLSSLLIHLLPVSRDVSRDIEPEQRENAEHSDSPLEASGCLSKTVNCYSLNFAVY